MNLLTFNQPRAIGIVGSRRRDTEEDLFLCRIQFLKLYRDGDMIVSGGCKQGGDRFAEIFVDELGIRDTHFICHLPNKNELDPELLKKVPRAAYAKINYARNTLIAIDSTHLIAVPAPDRKGGTEDTIKKFIKFHGESTLYLV
jgi:hypothetical protein